jgi:hypothetical protein
MARDHARINLTIWGDPDFRALPMPAQHLYLVLWTHPDLSYCGAMEWRPGKLSGLTAGWGRADVEYAADCLRARHFIVVDEETEEVLIRSWVRWDGLMKQPRMAVSCITAYGNIGSEVLRRAFVFELRNLRERHPELPCWGDDRIAQVLTHPAVSAKHLPQPEDPWNDLALDPSLGSGLGVDLPQTRVGVYTPSTPAPAPAPITPTPASSAPATPSRATSAADDRFDEFWDLYPKKRDKGHAKKAWKTATKKTDPQDIIDGLRRQLPLLTQGDPKFIPYGATWLNGERWADEMNPAPTGTHGWWDQ